MEELELKKFDMRRVKPTNVCAFLAQRNSGKCLAKGTGVMMFEETTKKVEDIQVGDLVMGDDQTPRTVLGINNGVDELYEIKNEYGTNYTVNSQHILSLLYSRQKILKKFDHSYKISWFNKHDLKYTTRTFVFNMENREDVFVRALVFYRNIVDDLKVDISVEKYLSLKKNDRKYFHGYQQSLNFSEKRVLSEDYENLVVRIFKDLDGEIPHQYKYNSKDVRCKLLMAIVSYTGANLNSCMKVYHRKLDDSIFIARTLGLQVKIVSEEEIHIKREPLHTKISIKSKGKGEYYGFELDGNHKFYLENCVITHNSFLIRDLLYYQQTLPAGLVVSKTDKLTHYYEQFIPPVLIHDEYSPELIDKLFDRQKKAIEQEWSNPHVFLIFDDTLSDAGTWKKDPRIKEIFFNGRHYKILFLLTMQDPMSITPGLRCNIDFTFILRTPNQKNRKDLYDNYCGMFPSREIFEKVLDACTEDFGCLVIDNTTRSNKLEDQVFYYKASDHEQFKLCPKQFWQQKKSIPKRDENTKESKFILKKKNAKFIVRKN